jgi:hypothetical protein
MQFNTDENIISMVKEFVMVLFVKVQSHVFVHSMEYLIMEQFDAIEVLMKHV